METGLSASLTKRLKKTRESVHRQTELKSGNRQPDIREVKTEALLQEARGGSIHIESESIDENTKRHGTRVILKIPYN